MQRIFGVPGIYEGINLDLNDPVAVIRGGQRRVVPAMLLGTIASEGRLEALVEGVTLKWVPKAANAALDEIVELARAAKKVANSEIREVVYRFVSDPALAEAIIDELQLIVDALFNGVVGIVSALGGFIKGMVATLEGLVSLMLGLGDWIRALLKGIATGDAAELREKWRHLVTGLKGIPRGLAEYFRQWVGRYKDADDTEQARMIGELTGEVLAILATSGGAAAKLVGKSWQVAEKVAVAGEEAVAKVKVILPKVKEALTEPPLPGHGMRPAHATPGGPPPIVGAAENTSSLAQKISPGRSSAGGGTGRGSGTPKKGESSAARPEGTRAAEPAPIARARSSGRGAPQRERAEHCREGNRSRENGQTDRKR